MQEYRRNQGLPVHPSGEQGSTECGKLPLGAEAAGTEAFEPRLTTSPLSNEHSADPLWYQSHLRAHQAELAQFKAAGAERMKPQKRFSWAGLLALLAVAAVVAWFVWTVAGGF